MLTGPNRARLLQPFTREALDASLRATRYVDPRAATGQRALPGDYVDRDDIARSRAAEARARALSRHPGVYDPSAPTI